MAYFVPYIDETGLHMPTYADRLDDLCSAYRSIFGNDVALDPATPDYQLLSVLAKALDDTSALVLQAYNSRNPAYARGAALDLLLPQYGLSRYAGTYSMVTLGLTGRAGTVIPGGSLVSDGNGYLWKTPGPVTLNQSGAALVQASCQTPGPVEAAANTITNIVTPVTGWTGVNNPSAATPGVAPETDASVRNRIAAAMASLGSGSADALLAALKALEGVTEAALLVNDTGSTDGNGIPTHSIAAVVEGGDVLQIGQALYFKKAPGIRTYGSTAVSFTEEGVTHLVYFSRPTELALDVKLEIMPLNGFDGNEVLPLLRSALAEYLGTLKIGESLTVPRLYGVCYAIAPELASTFMVTYITAQAGSYTRTSQQLAIGWREKLTLDDPATQITFEIVEE